MAPGKVVRFLTLTIDPKDPRWLAFLADEYAANRGQGVREARGRLLNGDAAATQASIRYASASWNRLRTSLSRLFCECPRPAAGSRRAPCSCGGRVHYYRAIETHKSGMAHLHLLIRVDRLETWFVSYSRFRALAVAAGFGPVLDVQAVKSRTDAGRYVAKATAAYASKGDGEAVGQWLPKYTRRGSVSREWSDWTPPTRLAGFTWRLASAGVETVKRALVASDFVMVDPGSLRVSAAGSGGGLSL